MKFSDFSIDYDEIGDVLYIMSEDSARTKNEEDEAGLVLRYDLATHRPVGATVIDYKEHWLPQRDALASRLAHFFNSNLGQVKKVMRSVR